MGNNLSSSSSIKDEFLNACQSWKPEHDQPAFEQLLQQAISSQVAYECRDSSGNTCLHLCVEAGNEKAVRRLVKAFPRLATCSNHKSVSPIHSAIKLKRFAIARIILLGGDLNVLYQQDGMGNSALHYACYFDNLEFLQEMTQVDSSDVLISMVNLESKTPLGVALENCSDPLSYAKLLLPLAPEAVHRDDNEGKTVLHLAIVRNLSEVVEYFLKNGAVLGATTKDGKGVLQLSAIHKAKECFMVFMKKYRPPVNIRDLEGNSPLHYTILQGDSWLECTQMLIEGGADCYFKNKNNQTPLEFLKAKLQEDKNLQQSDYQSTIQFLEKILKEHPPPPEPKISLRLQFCSDIHVEFDEIKTVVPKAPYLALLGDIGVTHQESYRKYLLNQAEYFEKVFVVAGNHEFYNNTVDKSLEDIKKICQEKSNLIFLNNTSLLVEGVRILGCTLWSHILPDQELEAGFRMNDYRLIHLSENGKTRNLKPQDTIRWHKESVEWLKKEIEGAKSRGEKVVILTHHCPLWELGCSAAHDYGVGCYSAFCSNLHRLFGPPVVYWLYGHLHWFNDVTINSTRIISNPGGYPQEHMPFQDDFVIQV